MEAVEEKLSDGIQATVKEHERGTRPFKSREEGKSHSFDKVWISEVAGKTFHIKCTASYKEILCKNIYEIMSNAMVGVWTPIPQTPSRVTRLFFKLQPLRDPKNKENVFYIYIHNNIISFYVRGGLPQGDPPSSKCCHMKPSLYLNYTERQK